MANAVQRVAWKAGALAVLVLVLYVALVALKILAKGIMIALGGAVVVIVLIGGYLYFKVKTRDR